LAATEDLSDEFLEGDGRGWVICFTCSEQNFHKFRRNRHLRSQYRCQSTRSARRRYLRDRTCRLTWTLLGRAVVSHVHVVTRHGWWRSPSSGVGRSAVSVSSGIYRRRSPLRVQQCVCGGHWLSRVRQGVLCSPYLQHARARVCVCSYVCVCASICV